MSRLRVAVIGAGRLGGFHAQKLARLDQVELVGVVDPSPAARQRVAAECRTAALEDFRDLAGRVDAAVVAAPTHLHHAIAAEMLNRGVHLLVEKPLCPSRAEAAELVRLAQRAGVVLQVGHVERFNPAFAAAVPYASASPPKYVEAVRTSGFTFRSTDVGVVMDLMIHDLDLVLSMIRSPVRRVQALGLSVMGGHEDVANARVEFQCGCVAALSASRVSYEATRRMHVWSANAFASIDFAARKTTVVEPSDALRNRRFDVNRLTPEELQHKEELLQQHLVQHEYQAEAVDALALEVLDFVESIRTPRAPRVSGEDGLSAVALAEQILDQIHAHAWDDQLDGLVGPMAVPRPSVIPAPHFQTVPSQTPHRHREAG